MTAPAGARRIVIILSLGTTQTLAWASSFYLPSVLAVPMAAELGLSVNAVFAVFSAALLLSAGIGPAIGRRIDRHGGRDVLWISNLVFAAGLGLLAFVQGPVGLALAWAVIGLGMGMGLYDSAFATLAGLYGAKARGPITGITLLAGFASTVGWPLTAYLDGELGWRGACLVWAGLHLCLGLPMNRLLVPQAPPPARAVNASAGAGGEREMILLAFVFAAAWVVSTGIASQLPRLLQAAGHTPAEAIAAAALLGPAQVGARILEFGLLRRAHPLIMARIAALMHPLGAAALLLTGNAASMTVLHGGGNGLFTIAKGTLPLAIFGPAGYGARSGLISLPARIGQAAAPLLFGLLIDGLGTHVLIVSTLLYLAAFAALLMLKARSAEPVD